MKKLLRQALHVFFMLASTIAMWGQADAPAARPDAGDLAARILRADYQGDLAALSRLHAEMAALVDDSPRASRLRYWSGFALWRRAINGVNDKVDRKELLQNVDGAVREFEDALKRDPAFVDARVGIISCLQIQASLTVGDPAQIKEVVARFFQLIREGQALAPDNPRLLWVQGMQEGYTPPGTAPDQIEKRRAMSEATYQRALGLARKQPRPAPGSLEPVWGEPELLMSLAWSSLNRTVADVAAAERYATEALRLVPNWRYVRDFLMPQIQRARK